MRDGSSGVKVQLMQYQAHLVNSNLHPVVQRRYSQPWATRWRLLVVMRRQLFIQSLVYYRLSSTKPMIVFFFSDNIFIGASDGTTFV